MKVKFKTYMRNPDPDQDFDTGTIIETKFDDEIGEYYIIKPDKMNFDRIVRTKSEIINDES